MHYLSKSDFKLARDCPTKLYYKKKNYPSDKDDDPYLQMVAEGGYMIGKMAQIMYPDGILLDYGSDHELCVKETEELLKKENVTIFEAAICAGDKLIRVDILEKKGNTLNLIEVKAKSFDGEIGKRQFWNRSAQVIKTDWVEYLEDVTFQANVLSEAYPEAKVNSFLMMPDKTKATSIDKLASFFEINKVEPPNPLDRGLLTNESPAKKFRNYKIEFSGDEELLRKDSFLILIDVNKEVAHLRSDVADFTELFSHSLNAGKSGEIEKIHTQINKKCRNCEFRGGKDEGKGSKAELNGFKECWGDKAKTEPHILDLYFMGALGQGTLINELIEQDKTSMYDVDPENFTGVRGRRQQIQVEQTQKNEEWFEPNFGETLSELKYPLHFIDFETYQSAVPYHKGMRPYEKIAFQWSCHTLESPDAEPVHTEFLNTVEYFPNFEFASALMNTVAPEGITNGTILTWSAYEEAILRDICKQLENPELANGYKNETLKNWLTQTVRMHKDDKTTLVDMNQLCFEGYFHPQMKGKTSIKYVLPAIWNNNPDLHEIDWLKKYVKKQEGQIISPYKVLEEIEIAGKAEEVREGTGAMRAYEEMVYGESKNNEEIKQKWANLLREYCKLDTLAMVVIWLYWWRRVV